MKRLLIAIFVLTLSAWSQTGPMLPSGVPFTIPAAGASLSVDSGSPQISATTTAATITQALTIGLGCTNSMLVVAVGVADTGVPRDVTGITYNSVSMTQFVDYQVLSGHRDVIYTLANPTHDGASHNVVVTLAGTTAVGQIAAVIAFCGAATTFDNTNTTCCNNIASGTPISFTMPTLTSGDAYVSVCQGPISQSVTVGDSATSIGTSTPDGLGFGYKLNVSGASVTPSCAIGAGGGAAQIAVIALKHA